MKKPEVKVSEVDGWWDEDWDKPSIIEPTPESKQVLSWWWSDEAFNVLYKDKLLEDVFKQDPILEYFAKPKVSYPSNQLHKGKIIKENFIWTTKKGKK